MEVSGFDSVFFGDVEALHVLAHVAASIKFHWGRLMREEALLTELAKPLFPHGLEFLFCRDMKMRRLHDRCGYVLDDEGQGCFLLMVRPLPFLHARIVVEAEQGHSPFPREPYHATLMGRQLLEYTLVTPENPQSDPFSGRLVAMLLAALGEPPSVEGSSK